MSRGCFFPFWPPSSGNKSNSYMWNRRGREGRGGKEEEGRKRRGKEEGGKGGREGREGMQKGEERMIIQYS